MKRRIIIDRESIRKLMKVFGVTEQTVYSALRYDLKSDKAERIRYVARTEMGGIDFPRAKE